MPMGSCIGLHVRSLLLISLSLLLSPYCCLRDIKGGNILVDESTVKLADFGASTTISLGETEELSTIAGTPYFMAPEVFVSKYGRRGDIWAVGCTIIQMLTGDPPWKDRKLHSIIQLHVLLSTWVGIPPLTREIPDDLRSFLELCFEKNPKNRPMAETLLRHPFLSDLSVSSSRRSLSCSHSPCPLYPPVGMKNESIVLVRLVGLIFVNSSSVPQLAHTIVPMRTRRTFTMPREGHRGSQSRRGYLTGPPPPLLSFLDLITRSTPAMVSSRRHPTFSPTPATSAHHSQGIVSQVVTPLRHPPQAMEVDPVHTILMPGNPPQVHLLTTPMGGIAIAPRRVPSLLNT
jgi:serine/threonine protein kinase